MFHPDGPITDVRLPRCSTGYGGGVVRGDGGGPGFSFSGFSASTSAFCNKCLQTLLGCVPTLYFPGAGCFPLILSGSRPNDVVSVWDWINCALSLPWPSRPRKTPSQDIGLGGIRDFSG